MIATRGVACPRRSGQTPRLVQQQWNELAEDGKRRPCRASRRRPRSRVLATALRLEPENGNRGPRSAALLTTTRASYDTVAADYECLLRDGVAGSFFDRATLGVFAERVLAGGDGPVGDLGCGPGRLTAIWSRSDWTCSGSICRRRWPRWRGGCVPGCGSRSGQRPRWTSRTGPSRGRSSGTRPCTRRWRNSRCTSRSSTGCSPPPVISSWSSRWATSTCTCRRRTAMTWISTCTGSRPSGSRSCWARPASWRSRGSCGMPGEGEHAAGVSAGAQTRRLGHRTDPPRRCPPRPCPLRRHVVVDRRVRPGQ